VPAPMSSTQPPSPPAIQIPLAHLAAPPDPTRRFRLLELVRRRLRERRYSRRTEQAYVFWIRRYILFHDRRDPRHLGPEHVREFLSALALRERVAASTQNQALAALRFLYERVLHSYRRSGTRVYSGKIRSSCAPGRWRAMMGANTSR
jgi:hypothetical protein